LIPTTRIDNRRIRLRVEGENLKLGRGRLFSRSFVLHLRSAIAIMAQLIPTALDNSRPIIETQAALTPCSTIQVSLSLTASRGGGGAPHPSATSLSLCIAGESYAASSALTTHFAKPPPRTSPDDILVKARMQAANSPQVKGDISSSHPSN